MLAVAQASNTAPSASHEMSSNKKVVRHISGPGNRKALPLVWQRTMCFYFFIGTLCFRRVYSRDRSQYRSKRTAWELYLFAPCWSGGRGFNILGHALFGNWQYVMRPSCLRPDDSPIFRACWEDNIGRIRQLLDDGLASPFDVDSWGQTPLYVSTSLTDLDLSSRRIVCRATRCSICLSATHRKRRRRKRS